MPKTNKIASAKTEISSPSRGGGTCMSQTYQIPEELFVSSKSEEGAVLSISDFRVLLQTTRKQPVANNQERAVARAPLRAAVEKCKG